ncbi:MAG: AAA family ATPase [Bdellovibrionales bacterium]|nr:AAA family ATPase [Bdellovibrionales bacterium]
MSFTLDQYLKGSFEQPQIIFTIGIPGSGKSYSLREASAEIWTVINSDQLRLEKIKKMKEAGERLRTSEGLVLVDEKNPRHVFSAELRAWVYAEVDRLLTECLFKKRNIIFDVTNLTLQRVLAMNRARQQGYEIIGVMFEPQETAVHSLNVQARVDRGGLDLAADKSSRDEIIDSLRRNYFCFLESIKEDREFKRSFNDTISFDWQKLKVGYKDFSELKQSLSSQDLETLEFLQNYDVFNRIFKLTVGEY